MIRHKPGNKIKTIPEPQKLSMTRTGKSLVNSGSFVIIILVLQI